LAPDGAGNDASPQASSDDTACRECAAFRPAGRAVGFRLRLLETEGRAGQVHVCTFRRLQSAMQTDFRGEMLATLPVHDNTIELDLNPYEWVQLEGEWELPA
jgi:hypothetical protein